MPEPLWKIRQRKGLNINQLASKSGVPAISIQEYESGRAIRGADLPKLAKALFVEEWDIEIQGKPPAKKKPATPAPAPKPTPAAKPPAVSPPARPSQIEHLLNLTIARFGKDRAALEAEIGKPLEQMTKLQAGQLLNKYQKLLAESQETRSPEEREAKRKRAYLPEGVDGFELQYLTAQQEQNALLTFTLFDGQQFSGRIVGFSPYSITIREEQTQAEVTLQKLAVAYYRAARAEGGEP
jgi:transcriptional regulator with XRE-family HTH domain